MTFAHNVKEVEDSNYLDLFKGWFRSDFELNSALIA